MGDWSELLPELLDMIAKRVLLVEDFEVFRDVCISWREAADASKQDFNNSGYHVPLLMLAEKKDDSDDDREFFSLSRGVIWRTLSLPELRGKKCLQSKGWLITIEKSGEMNLLNPFTRVQIDLPNQTTFPEHNVYGGKDCFVNFSRAVLSATPNSDDCSLMIAHGGARFAAYWRPGDKVWTRIEGVGYHCGAFSDVTYYNGKFYAIDFGGSLWVCRHVSAGGGPAYEFEHVVDLTIRFPECFSGGVDGISALQSYLVESSGELLIVTRDGVSYESDGDDEFSNGDEDDQPYDDDDDDNGDEDYPPYDDDDDYPFDEDDPLDDDQPPEAADGSYGVKNFQVFQLDLIKLGCKKITSLGNRAIFVGLNSAISIDATSFPGVIKPNCIYFTDDSEEAYSYTKQGGGADMGIYHVEDAIIERFPDFQSFSFIGPPLWVMPSV